MREELNTAVPSATDTSPKFTALFSKTSNESKRANESKRTTVAFVCAANDGI